MSAHGSHQARVHEALAAAGTRQVPGTVQAAAIGGIVWGLGALGFGLSQAEYRSWTLGGVIVALVMGFGVAQGGVLFSSIQTAIQGRWGRPLKRIAESFGLALPILYVLYVAFLLLGIKVFPWHPHTITGEPVALAPHSPTVFHAKEWWLDPTVFTVRHIVVLGAFVLLDLVYLRASLKPDLIAAAQSGGATPGWWRWITGGETDVAKAAAAGAHTQKRLAPVIALCYALVMSMVAFDLIMSLDPWWVSNMFGGWIFMSTLWMTLNFLGAFTLIGRDWLGLGSWVTTSTTHDLGRFILALCMFWAYTLYAQILPIYYTDVPEETGFLMVRLMLPQWNPLSKIVAILCFVAPFTILLSRGLKKMRWPFVAVNFLILFGLFLERSLLVLPSVWFGETVPWGMLFLVNLGLVAGTFGIVVLVAVRALSRMPALPVTDAFLETHPWDQHVHGLDGHGAHGHGAH